MLTAKSQFDFVNWPQTDNISEEVWKKILDLRKFFTMRFESRYKHKQGKEEILRTFQAKRLFESIGSIGRAWLAHAAHAVNKRRLEDDTKAD